MEVYLHLPKSIFIIHSHPKSAVQKLNHLCYNCPAIAILSLEALKSPPHQIASLPAPIFLQHERLFFLFFKGILKNKNQVIIWRFKGHIWNSFNLI